jgi:endonuclease YncB( thermonuclease family)
MRWFRVSLVVSTVLLASCAALPETDNPAVGSSTPSGGTNGRAVEVVRIVDGDTIVVAIGGTRGTKVRLIGIDTPERGDCMFKAATERMRALVEGKSVRLERDVSETDRYGRLLRYVYAGDTFVNAAMVREGFANAATFPPDVAHAMEFVALERIARDARRGLWAGGCAA